jgi:hypothetical protein
MTMITLKQNNNSAVHTASIIRVINTVVMEEAVCTSEMAVYLYKTTQYHVPVGCHIYTSCHKKLKCHFFSIIVPNNLRQGTRIWIGDRV